MRVVTSVKTDSDGQNYRCFIETEYYKTIFGKVKRRFRFRHEYQFNYKLTFGFSDNTFGNWHLSSLGGYWRKSFEEAVKDANDFLDSLTEQEPDRIYV